MALGYAPCNGRAGVPSELAETATHNADRLHAFLLQDSVVSFHLVRQCAPASRHSQESGGAPDRNTGLRSATVAVRCISSALCCGDHGGPFIQAGARPLSLGRPRRAAVDARASWHREEVLATVNS